MTRRFQKLNFILNMLLYRIRPFLMTVGVRYDIVQVANDFYREDFNGSPRRESAVMLPHCLIDAQCPAKFSKEDGILCTQCKRCKCGEIKALCEEAGLQFYISPSSGFTKRLAQRKNLKAAIGAVCDFEIEKELRSVRITPRGIKLKQRSVIPQVIRTARYDCLKNEIDWELLKRMITSGA